MLISLDLETACAMPGCPCHGKSLCENDHALSPWHAQITVIGVVELESGNSRVFRGPEKIAELQSYLAGRDLYSLIGHNFKFDLLFLWVHGAKIPVTRWVGCTQLMAYVLTEKIPDSWLSEYNELREQLPNKGTHRKGGKHSLKTLAPYHLGVAPFWEVEGHDNDEYVLKDARYTADLYPILEERLRAMRQWDFYIEKQLQWTKMLVAAEFRGVELDIAALKEMSVQLEAKAVELRQQLDTQWADAHEAYSDLQRCKLIEKYSEMASKKGKALIESPRHTALMEKAQTKIPKKLDYDSPKQMLWLFKECLGYDCESIEGDEGTGREILERLADEGKEDIKVFLEWRKTNKILSSFLPTYLDLQKDGVIHPIFNPSNTRTGRTSSERPNCQQVPPNLRSLFRAREGYSFIGYDAAAIEAKLIALYSEDPTLYEIIDQGISLHDYNSKEFLGLECPVDEVKSKYPLERAATKNVGFALFYNAGANRIRAAYAQKGFHLALADCKRIHERFKTVYAPAYEFANEVVAELETGSIMTNLLGRPVQIEHPEDCYMKAFNTLIQGSASDLNLEGSHRATERMRATGLDAYPVLFVHDFACWEVANKDVETANSIIKESLTGFELNTRHGPIRLEVEGGVMARWEK